MAQFLLELFSEEIPARMQAGAARDLDRLARAALTEAALEFAELRSFAGPRRLTLVVDGLPLAQADRAEERKGPRVGAPDAAIDGFLRSTGLTRDQLSERDGAWFAVIAQAGRPTAAILGEIIDAIVRKFPWPKSMTWGAGSLRWVRPLHRILALFDGQIVPIDIDGIVAGDMSEGHRVMGSRRPFAVRDFDAYRAALTENFVVLDADERKGRILAGGRALCSAKGLELVEDGGLTDEVAGMAEWPVPILGDMDAGFLTLPPEVIRTSMRVHQRYFAVREAGGALAPHFVAIANLETPDGGALIAAGNGRVLSARLNDACFFWDEDRKTTLESRLEALKGVTFHAKLGAMHARATRLEALARALAPHVGADPNLAALAGRLAKADLASGMVGEFPELQGVMGGYYARAEGLDPAVATAIAEHYKPQGPMDNLPTDPVAVAVALADKLDTIVGFFSIGEKPTGSRDPYALRRAALGVIRIVLDKRRDVSLQELVGLAAEAHSAMGMLPEVMDFFRDRLQVMLRDQGGRHDLVSAVMASGYDRPVFVVDRLAALTRFLGSEDGVNLLAAYKRATNILEAEAKKGLLPAGSASDLAGAPREEMALLGAFRAASPNVYAAMAGKDYEAAMGALAGLRRPVDAFFDEVLINSPDPRERDNRLRLLIEVRDAMNTVADFALILG